MQKTLTCIEDSHERDPQNNCCITCHVEILNVRYLELQGHLTSCAQQCEKNSNNEVLDFSEQGIASCQYLYDSFNEIGDALMRLKKDEQAFHYFQKAFQLKKQYLQFLEIKSKIFQELNRFEDALICEEQIQHLKKYDLQFSKGAILQQLRKPNEALIIYDNQLLQNEHKDQQKFQNQSYLQNQLNFNDKDIEVLVLALKSYNQDTAYNKGSLLLELKMFEEALMKYDSALINYGNTLLESSQYEQALKCYNSALKINPQQSIVLTSKGNTLYFLKKYKKALKCYDAALKISPLQLSTLINKGATLIELRNYEQALICYDAALIKNPQQLNALINKGNILTEQKNYEQALKYYNLALNIDPQQSNVLNNKGDQKHKLLGNILYNLQKYEEALTLYDAALKINPQQSEILINKGNAFTELKNYEQASKCYDAALMINPQSTDALYYKGNALIEQRNYEQTKCYETALMTNPKIRDAQNSQDSNFLENKLKQLQSYKNNLKQCEEPLKCYNATLKIHPWYTEEQNNTDTFVYMPPDTINIANTEYKVREHITIPQGAALFCYKPSNQRVVIKESELMVDIENKFVSIMFNQQFQNVAKVSIIYTKSKKYYYIMESSDLTLDQQMLESPEDIMQQARLILKQILNGIAELHAIGWVHMKIQSTSIFIDRKYDNLNKNSDTYKLSIWQSFLDFWNAQSKQSEYDAICKKHQNLRTYYKIDLQAFGLLAFRIFTGIDFSVQKIQDQIDYQEINLQLQANKSNIDPVVYLLLSEIFDVNSQKTAADIAQLFETYLQEDANKQKIDY